jgi:ATP-dependent 26S proteasome regulatory subunit
MRESVTVSNLFVECGQGLVRAGVQESTMAVPMEITPEEKQNTNNYIANQQPQERESAESIVAGMSSALSTLRELIVWPVIYWEEGLSLGVQWPRGVLLHGPPGVGKTLLVNAVARECGASVHPLSAASVFGAFAGESEQRMRDMFGAAEREAQSGRPAIVFIDEIDALCPRRDAR